MPLLDKIVQATTDLIQLPSESSDPIASGRQAPEEAVKEYLLALCRKNNLKTEIFEALPGRHNLLVSIANPGAPKIVFVAHMDTVSGRGMNEPFSGSISNNRIWGRGACDDKGPLAAVFMTLLDLHANGRKMRYDVQFAATVDEECTMSGAEKLAEKIGGWDLCLALEPTGLKLVKAHKGVYRFRVETSGLAAHSSAPQLGRNAILDMFPIINDLMGYDGKISTKIDPELGAAHLSITRIQGGSSINIIPDQCRIEVDVRLLPHMDPAMVGDEIREIVGSRGKITEIFRGNGMSGNMSLPIIRSFRQSLEAVGEDPQPITVPFSTDCSKMAHKGPCAVWGPGNGAMAHKRNEYIDISELEKAARILQHFLTGKVTVRGHSKEADKVAPAYP